MVILAMAEALHVCVYCAGHGRECIVQVDSAESVSDTAGVEAPPEGVSG